MALMLKISYIRYPLIFYAVRVVVHPSCWKNLHQVFMWYLCGTSVCASQPLMVNVNQIFMWQDWLCIPALCNKVKLSICAVTVAVYPSHLKQTNK